eukprot:COSAG04_NODE_478_length_13690_cov_7.415569_7_plen_191_part_00
MPSCDIGAVLDTIMPCTKSAKCMYYAGPVLVTGALSLISYAASVDYRYLLPSAAAAAAGGAATAERRATKARDWWLHASVSGFLLGNVLYNYVRCAATNVPSLAPSPHPPIPPPHPPCALPVLSVTQRLRSRATRNPRSISNWSGTRRSRSASRRAATSGAAAGSTARPTSGRTASTAGWPSRRARTTTT